MNDWIYLGPQGTLHVFGVKLVGLNAESGEKLLVSFLLISFVLIIGAVIKFTIRQGLNLFLAFLALFGLVSI